MFLSNRFSYAKLSPAQRVALRSLIPPNEPADALAVGIKTACKPATVCGAVALSPAKLSKEEQMHAELLKFFRERDFEGVAVTLTFRTAVPPAILTEEAAQGAINELLKRLNKFAAGRNRRPLQVIAVREGGTGALDATRLHYHLKIEVPPDMTGENFAFKIEQYWTRLKWASRKQNFIRPTSDDGWLSYITKKRSKRDYAYSFDWLNTYLLPLPIAECSGGG